MIRCAAIALLSLATAAAAEQAGLASPTSQPDRAAPQATTPNGFALSSAHPAATAAGQEILMAGGNAFDAAVAVSAALAVAEPTGSGIGGGGFWLLHVGKTGDQIVVDGRETAPAAATADMYQTDDGTVVSKLSKNGALAAAIPGEPAALAHIAKKYGALPLAKSLAPAIRLAREGFPVDAKLLARMGWRFEALSASPAAREVFLPGGGLPEPGSLILQPDLATTLERLAQQGRDGFYTGETAKLLVDGVRAAGGIWTLDDLAGYRIVERAPMRLTFGDHVITVAPPPSSGGVVFAQVLPVLEQLGWQDMTPVNRKHVLIEALRTAYRDRAAWLGDPDHVDMPIERITSAAYLADVARAVSLERARRSADMPGPVRIYAGGQDTTHFSVIDEHGNRVSATLSINLPFGSGFMPPGTGVLLNDEMDDFSAKPGTPNAYGLVGTAANAVGPKRRPLSSMTPLFVDGPKRTAILGTPGGSRIITMNLLATLAFIDGADADTMVSAPRYHHQYLPDEVYFEPGALSVSERATLEARGFALRESGREYGNMHAVVWDRAENTLDASADPRGIGAAAAGKAGGPSIRRAVSAGSPGTRTSPADR